MFRYDVSFFLNKYSKRFHINYNHAYIHAVDIMLHSRMYMFG